MVRARTVAVATIIAAVAGGVVYLVRSGGSPITQAWVDKQLPLWAPTTTYPMTYSTQFTRASYNNPGQPQNTLAVLEAELAMLLSTGAKQIRMDLDYNWVLQNNSAVLSEIDTLVATIRGAGAQLVIADAGATYYFNNPLPWDQFKTVWPERVSFFSQRYSPDYYITVKEPGWYVPMVSDATTNPTFQDPNDWLNLVSSLQTAAGTTKTGVSVAADWGGNTAFYTQLLNGLRTSPITFMGFDIYNVAGFTTAQNYISTYGAGSKQVWIAEAWSATGSGAFDSSRAQLDVSWMKLLWEFCQSQVGAAVVSPFFTDCFCSYSIPTTESALLSMYATQRQPVFTEFSNVIAGHP